MLILLFIIILSCEEMQGGKIPCNPFNMDTFPSPYIPVMINHYLCPALTIRCGSESCNIQKIYEEKYTGASLVGTFKLGQDLSPLK